MRTNSVKDLQADTSFNLTHGRFSIGAQFVIGQFETGNGQVSVEVATARFRPGDYDRAFGGRRRSLTTTEVVLIIPIADKVGILGQYVSNGALHETAWRGGVALRP